MPSPQSASEVIGFWQMLSSSAWRTSWRDFRANLRPISQLALGLVLLTTVVVAVVAHVLIPDLPWAVAFVLGAIVSPTDAVAATAIAQRLSIRLPGAFSG